MKDPCIHIALPMMDESEYLPALLDSLRRQTFRKFRVVACVNQPDSWWEVTTSDDKSSGQPDAFKDVSGEGSGSAHDVCLDNRKTLEILSQVTDLEISMIDRSSPGKGWDRKNYGVGWARKSAMDFIAKEAENNDIILSLDGDTTLHEDYLLSVVSSFRENPGVSVLAIPYYHLLTGREPEDRSILRYEIYMRYYLLNLLRIESPYAFTAIGSAMGLTAGSYKRVGGITPFKSGEDFYFMQKLAKSGKVGIWSEIPVHPAARFSQRVFFGTGPAMIKGSSGDWDSYPLYPYRDFNLVAETCRSFPLLFRKKVTTPMDEFLAEKFAAVDPWDPLRKNFRDERQFVNACHRKVDALRILQYLKGRGKNGSDEGNLLDFLDEFYQDGVPDNLIKDGSLDFSSSSVEELGQIRDFLYEREMEERKKKRFTGIW